MDIHTGGGMHSITKSLYDLARRNGVKFNFNSFVNEIIIKKSSGILVDGKKLPFDTVVSNMDIYPTYEKLMPKIKLPNNIKTKKDLVQL